ncbi:hypothetical protein FGO68_gene14729 [Halteria grandinella]|uniref:Uncharacterized protein n=1 Tax=Halteria grandinella TaxID=5974 RepID=A0A8J8NM37_HALGN|nr:hypothetical protein FGO68_gene14729 [Halteria grandinella]
MPLLSSAFSLTPRQISSIFACARAFAITNSALYLGMCLSKVTISAALGPKAISASWVRAESTWCESVAGSISEGISS